MKGIVFSELFELVEAEAGYELVDRIILECGLESEGAYTSVGTYEFSELATIVGKLSEITQIPADVLIKKFGHHLFKSFSTKFGEFFKYETTFDLLQNVQDIIHVEVCKLYPNAELPTFQYSSPSDGVLQMYYESTRPLADLCQGLIEGCIDHFGENIELRRQDHNDQKTRSLFTLTKSMVPLIA